MVLPDTFQFSQSSLQDYVDCPRRFELRHVLMQPWPALVTNSPGDLEQHMQRGARFHRLAHQHNLGLDSGVLARTIDDPVLSNWWRTFQEHEPSGWPKHVRRSEVMVAAPLAEHRLVAKFDLLAVEPGKRFLIVDWKTMLKHPSRADLAQRLQTRIYRYLAVEAGADFNDGQRPEPNQIEMVYWFAALDGASEHFPYSASQHAAACDYLTALINEIDTCHEATWPLTPDEHCCQFCNYRSLCERGVTAGFLEDLDQDLELPELEIDLEQVIEVAF